MSARNFDLIIEAGPLETRAALVEGERVEAIWLGPEETGAIYAAKVTKADPSLGGAFLDLGEEEGFLNASDGALPEEGSTICVQMKRPAIGGKAALVTQKMTLTTPLLSWQPLAGKRKVSIAPEITSSEERERLTAMMDEKGFKGELRIRPYAMGLVGEAGRQAFTKLRMDYDAMNKAVKEDPTPRRLSPRQGASAALIYFADHSPKSIEVSGIQGFLDVKALVENDLSHRKVELIASQVTGIFEDCGAEEALEIALSREVVLRGGGRIVIDEAEALTAIDVDVSATQGQSYKGSIVKAALAAIPVIFQQLKMRRIGGQVVIDFPPIAVKGGGQVLSVLKTEAKKVPGARLGKLSDGGLFHLTMPRTNRSLLERMTTQAGEGPVPGRVFAPSVIAAKAVRKLEKELVDAPTSSLILTTAVDIAAWLQTHKAWSAPLAERFGPRFKVVSDETFSREKIDVSVKK